MPKNILLVESDTELSNQMKSALEARGFQAEITSDGKGCVDVVRRERPELVVLAVDLPAGQNGYILCGKLKKDDELRSIPIIITGSPDGFAQHRKLKTRADDYVSKPVDLEGFVQTVGALVGFPEGASGEDDGLSLSDLVEESEVAPVEEVAFDGGETTMAGDPDLDMLDSVFDDGAGEAEPVVEEVAVTEAPIDVVEEPLQALEEEPLEDDGADRTQIYIPPEEESAKPASYTAFTAGGDPTELRNLKARVAELEAALADAESRHSDADARAHDLENELHEKTSELEAARSTQGGGKSDKEFFSLREAANKKDKEILKLKSELNEKDQELVELRDREMQLEQQVSEAQGELARREAQHKTLSARADQLAAERKRSDQQLLSAKEEARGATARLTTLQTELDQLHGAHAAITQEIEALRERSGQLESDHRKAREELSEAQAELDGHRATAESARREADESRSLLETTQIELDAAKNQLASDAAAHEEELAALRQRLAELEDANQKHEERLTRLYARIKNEEKVREKTKKALAVASQLLEDHEGMVDLDEDESAAA